MIFQAVLFDCDGVLADSEGLANSIIAEELTALGWALDSHSAQREFLGLSLPDMRPVIEARIGLLPDQWEAALCRRIEQQLASDLVPIMGAKAALLAIRAAGLPMAVCSNSGRSELLMKMRVLDFGRFFGDRVFSYQDVARPKPAPDLYLTAALACSVVAADCLVVEDSAIGVKAGLAAGCQVVSLVEGLGVPHIADLSQIMGHIRA